MNTYTIARPASPETPLVDTCTHSGWKRQFGNPMGALGWAVGHLMAAKNAYMQRLAVEMLEVRPDDHILEVGFGPGVAIPLVAARATKGFVAGVDHSGLMVKQATRRNRAFIEAGRVELKHGTVSRLPHLDGQFTKVFDVNCFHLWPTPEQDLKEVRRVLKEGGLLLLCLRMKHPSRHWLVAPGFTRKEVDEAQNLLRQVGFRSIRTEVRQLEREVTCLLAKR